jgi:hypothetical protein
MGRVTITGTMAAGATHLPGMPFPGDVNVVFFADSKLDPTYEQEKMILDSWLAS